MTNRTSLLEFLTQTGLSNSESFSKFSLLWSPMSQLDSQQVIIQSGQTAKFLYFVQSGCTRLFIRNLKSEEITLGFGYQHSLITSYDSFIENQPSGAILSTILQTQLLRISRNDLFESIDSDVNIARWYQSILEKTISGHIKRHVALLTLTPRLRYEAFLSRSGHIINAIPLKYIASYLGMTQETLSRVRREIS